ncbi:hypothetical protein JKF63_06268 [Porcisia hertigi]|uniref:Cytoplasmic tRNA 2-thiolation protein 2 n=1 Tax=Porcisia hertigi TaxID=2761500 RepID=A0A836IZG4_9TRYP|nr:hypothetical protein JKF63_06268 [Porcisia hertigi]
MNQCFKCKQGMGTVVSRDGPSKLYCPDCFLAYCAGAVRENIFQRCLVPSDTPLAVAVSGGPNSMLLLHELGQLRCKAHEQQQQRVQHWQACEPGRQTSETVSSTVQTLSVSSLLLLPFHLCEDELVLPPPPSSSPSTTVSLHESRGRHEAIERVRSTMMEQFTTLRKYVQQQPPRWIYYDEASNGRKKAKKKRKRSVTAEMGMEMGPDANQVGDALPEASPSQRLEQRHAKRGGETAARMFGEAEVRLFQYSDFLPESYLSELRHALHASRLPLCDREALYARVRQQTLCRAAQRLCEEHLQREAAAAVAGRTADEKVTHRDEHALLPDASSKTWSHLLLGSNAVRCATAALEALVTGSSGEGVVHGAGFRGYTHEVVCLRPLRTMLPKETVMYTRLCGILCGYTPALCTGTAASSVHRTVEKFVLTMMTSYRTMIFNVLNTVQRLEVHPAAMQRLVRGTANTDASQAHTHREGSAIVESLQSVGKASRRTLLSRTAQQNRDNLRQTAPPQVHRDSRGVKAEEADINGTVAMCCVCGLPASVPACQRGSNANAEVRQLSPFAVNATDATRFGTSGAPPPLSAVAVADPQSDNRAEMVRCFVCYACRTLADAWPPSIFGAADSTKDDGTLQHGHRTAASVTVTAHNNAKSPTSSTLRLCELFH